MITRAKIFSYFGKMGWIIATLFLFFVINRIFQYVVKREINIHMKWDKGDKIEKKKETLKSVIGGTLKFFLWIVAILIVLSELGVNIGPLLTSLGLIGLAVGIASKDILSDVISGLFILLENQYQIGDRVQILGIEGVVIEFNLRRTILKDDNGFLHSIPNSQIKIVSKKLHSQ